MIGHMGEQAWSLIGLAATVAAIAIGLPVLLSGGGLLRRRGRIGRGRRDRVRVGPSWSVVLGRRLDSVLLAMVTVAYLIAVIVNAQG